MRAPARWAILISIVAVATLAGGATFTRVVAAPAPARTPVVVAQFGVGNLLGAGKDVAVRAALSAFGTSLGDELPIVVPAGDAYPTLATLPGAPFEPAETPDITEPLRASRDGTVALPPGDYAFPVGVFCMRAHSGSPSAHRYLVAPLRGSAADIITALNARIPSYAVEHHVLQVLSWDIQAGMAYAAMQPDARAAADRIIPDYRSRLNGDLYERIRDDYARTAQRVPGMPSFEEALTRIGPVGAQVVALQNLRQELAQPPPTFEELAHALVPQLPAGSNETAGTGGTTPWSRYSDRVFVRFVTEGNYATPGTYQVRVLPAGISARRAVPAVIFASSSGGPSLAVAAAGASVPFTNIVNNPGTDTVQPLTQTPIGSPAASAPRRPLPPARLAAPKPRRKKHEPPATITSQTVAFAPADRARRLVGVGEEVLLTFSGGYAQWDIRSYKDGAVELLGDTVLYTAASEPAYETITARGAHSSATITFQVIAPSGIIDRREPGTSIWHIQGRPTSGFIARSFMTPDTVSFENIDFIELEDGGVGTGFYQPMTGKGHHPNTVALPVGPDIPGLGSICQAVDTVHSGDTGAAPPFAPGTLTFTIPMEYRVRFPNSGSVAGAAFHPFISVEQIHSLADDRTTLAASKARTGVTLHVSDPTTR